MLNFFRFLLWAALLTLLGVPSPAVAQAAPGAGVRVLAPGIETTLPPELEPEETLSLQEVVELTADPQLPWKPQLLPQTRTLHSQAERVRFRQEVWGLELSFKPLRMLEVDLPTSRGSVERKLIWYMVYRVTNRGDRLRAVESQSGEISTMAAAPQPVTFAPQFVLESQDVDRQGNKIYKAYLDRILPAAMEPIHQRESPGRRLLNSVEMAQQPIPLSTPDHDQSVWGVVMWEEIDPQIDFLSVYVSGLTNAYQWANVPGGYQHGDPPGTGRRLMAKTLQLNFWRPGDEYDQSEQEIRFGVPAGKASLYGVEEGVAYRWLFR